MKRLFTGLILCLALAGCKSQGADFVGKWANQDGDLRELITVEKVDSGYRAVSRLNEQDVMSLDLKLIAESDTRLVIANTQQRALDMNPDGTVTSELRGKNKVFTRVQ